jgi:hypothetical protein
MDRGVVQDKKKEGPPALNERGGRGEKERERERGGVVKKKKRAHQDSNLGSLALQAIALPLSHGPFCMREFKR